MLFSSFLLPLLFCYGVCGVSLEERTSRATNLGLFYFNHYPDEWVPTTATSFVILIFFAVLQRSTQGNRMTRLGVRLRTIATGIVLGLAFFVGFYGVTSANICKFASMICSWADFGILSFKFLLWL